MAKYFDQETENGIIAFQQELDPQKRKDIFTIRVRPSFAKLIENIIFVYQFKSIENIEILENDCMSYLFECLFKFNLAKCRIGSKNGAFSYFNQIAKNWFLQEVKSRKKRIQQNIPITRELLEQSDDRKKFIIPHIEEHLFSVEFLKLLREEIDSWSSKVKNQQEKKVLDAVITLFEQIDDLQMLNKKSVYIYLRDISKLNTKQIALNLGKLKKRYALFKRKYYEGKI